MNKKKFILYIVLALVLLCVVVFFIQYKTKLNFNNVSSKDMLLTEFSSSDEIRMISERINYIDKNTSIYSIKRSKCVRSTDNGGYAIYLQENGEEYYVFFDENKKLFADTHVVRFVSSEEILNFEGCNPSKIFELGGYVKFPYYSSRETVFFFLTDGIAQITFNKPTLFEDAEIIKIEILSDNDYLSMNISWKPYILPEDRK